MWCTGFSHMLIPTSSHSEILCIIETIYGEAAMVYLTSFVGVETYNDADKES